MKISYAWFSVKNSHFIHKVKEKLIILRNQLNLFEKAIKSYY